MPSTTQEDRDREAAKEITRTTRREQGLPEHVEDRDAIRAVIATFSAVTHFLVLGA